MQRENELSSIVIHHAIQVHKTLGPGLLESVYTSCLFHSLSKTNLLLNKEHPIPVIYENIKLECGYRADLIVENKLIIEIKAVDVLNEVHKAQLLTYLRLTNLKLGLLINFNVVLLKDGIKRTANGLY
jgi:GxxExxY protein